MAPLFRGAVKRAAAMRSAVKSASAAKTTPSSSSKSFASKPCSVPTPQRWRLPAQLPRLGCTESLLPLHSAVAAARLTSCLTSASCDCRALAQELGLSVPR